MYEGALAFELTVDKRPDRPRVIADRLGRARATADARVRATLLRQALVALAAGPPAKRPLWDRLGGQPAVEAVVHDFVLAAAPDPKVNFFRDGAFPLDAAGVQKLERRMFEPVSGGLLKYTGIASTAKDVVEEK